ncbi:hypothetical protein [Clostridium sp.]|uniref:hypothetical protein n=1 Tax=Clostridium sp. TaxID=1506 RepID=UPI001A4389C1|nr:hypothetical protein [Clostridium sp.]MBK5243359.1 hypothetical protein [Clostridium sp.]
MSRNDYISTNGSLNLDTIFNNIDNNASGLADIVTDIKKFGAIGDGVIDNTISIQNAINYLESVGGGRLHFPRGNYKVSTSNVNYACLWIKSNNIEFTGVGDSSVIFTTDNAHVPIHFSSEKDLTIQPSGAELENFKVHDLCVKGTGIYENFGLAKGRGILFRNVKNVSIYNNLIKDMSMIGINGEGGDGYFNIHHNRVENCKYTAINLNGRCYQSIVSGNICSGSNAEVNTVSIQVTGHSIVKGNTILGEITTPQNCGGIMAGEGNFDGICTITNNLIKHCRFGIKSIYHSSANIAGNTLINCVTTGGINVIGGTTGGFTVANSDDLVANNLIINCAPYGIESSAENCLIQGNKIRNISVPVNPSATSEPDAIVVVTTQSGIRVRAKNNSIIGNDVSGCVRGLTTTIDKELGVVSANNLANNTTAYAIESVTSGTYAVASAPSMERITRGSDYREELFSGSRPVTGYYPLSSEWKPQNHAIGAPVGALILWAKKTTVAMQAVAGATTVTLTSGSGWLANTTLTVVGFELDNGAWHWTTVTAVSGNDVTLGTAIPTGRTVNVGANAFYNHWRNLPNLA